MNVLKGGVLGLLGGLLYAFISFYLMTPIFKQNITVIAAYGAQGFVLGAMFVFLKISRKVKDKYNKILIVNIIFGAISGLLSSSLGLMANYHNTLARLSGYATDEVRMSIISRTIEYVLGSLLIGLVTGLFIGLLEQKAKEGSLQ